MAESYAFGENTAEQSTLIGLPTAPPAYDEPPATVQQPNVVQPLVQPAQMGQYPQQVQVGGILPPQAWPQGQGYPVS